MQLPYITLLDCLLLYTMAFDMGFVEVTPILFYLSKVPLQV